MSSSFFSEDRDVENIKRSLKNLKTKPLTQALILQLIEVQNEIAESIKASLTRKDGSNVQEETSKATQEKQNAAEAKQITSRIVCQLCFVEFENEKSLACHLTEKDCFALTNKIFKEHKALSAFQIVSSNAIKCAVCKPEAFLPGFEHVSEHLQGKKHQSNLKSAKNRFSNLLYCTFCSVNVFLNATQFDDHVSNEVHVRRHSKMSPPPKTHLLKNNILFVLRSDNRCKCTVCGDEIDISDKSKAHNNFQNHLSNEDHVNKRENFSVSAKDRIKCMVCELEFDGALNLVFHLSSKAHATNTDAMKSPVKEKWCGFCKKKFGNVEDLADHQEKDCERVKELSKAEEKNLEDDVKYFKLMDAASGAAEGESDGDDVETVYISGLPSSINMKHVEKKLRIFGDIQDISKASDGVIEIIFKNRSSVDKILRNKELEIKDYRATISRDLNKIIKPEVKSPKPEKEENRPGNINSTLTFHSQDFSQYDKMLLTQELIKTTPQVTPKPKKEENPPGNLIPPGDLMSFHSQDLSQYDRLLCNPEKVLLIAQKLCEYSDGLNSPKENDLIGEYVRNLFAKSTYKFIGSREYNLALSQSSIDIFFLLSASESGDIPTPDFLNSMRNELTSRLKSFPQDIKKVQSDLQNNVLRLDFQIVPFKGVNVTAMFGNIWVYNRSNDVKHVINYDDRVRPLILIIKEWALDKELIGLDKFTGYVLTMMVIFFLKQDEIKILPKMLNSSDSSGAASKKSNLTIPELLHKFFSFYVNFNYRANLICLPLSQIKTRTELKSDLRIFYSTEYPLCMMDAKEVKVNLTKNVTKSVLDKFIEHGRVFIENLRF